MDKKRVAQYAIDPLKRFHEYIQESLRLLDMSMRGVSVFIAWPAAVKALQQYAETGSDEVMGADYERAQKEADFAKKEVEAGFPLFHAHTLVGLWGALFAAIEDSVVGMICNEQDLLSQPVFSKVRIPLSQFEILEREERIRFLVSEVSRGQSPIGSQGVDVFENLLDKIGLSGEVPPITKKLLFEMHNIRNVIVHRASIADRRLVENCPWLEFKVGDKVTVDNNQLTRYTTALAQYIVIVVCRLGPKYGVDMSNFDPLSENYPDLDVV